MLVMTSFQGVTMRITWSLNVLTPDVLQQMSPHLIQYLLAALVKEKPQMNNPTLPPPTTSRVTCPWGFWDLYGGWYPNDLLKMSAAEQMKQNIENGYLYGKLLIEEDYAI